MVVIVLLLKQASLGLQEQGNDPSPVAATGAVLSKGIIRGAEVERCE